MVKNQDFFFKGSQQEKSHGITGRQTEAVEGVASIQGDLQKTCAAKKSHGLPRASFPIGSINAVNPPAWTLDPERTPFEKRSKSGSGNIRDQIAE
jgi:hypothetical protein